MKMTLEERRKKQKPVVIGGLILAAIMAIVTPIAIRNERAAIEAAASAAPSQVESEPEDEEPPVPNYKFALEQQIATLYNGKVKFDAIWNFRTWRLGGLIYIENHFTTADDRDHTYLGRLSEDGALFYLRIDGETVFWDEEGETAYLDAFMAEEYAAKQAESEAAAK